jgi:hypothetical protein
MKNEMTIFIPYLCYCCSKGSIQKSDRAFEKFNANKKHFLKIDFVKKLFNEKYSELLNPDYFWIGINEIFNEVDNYFSKEDSKLVINSLKRLISLSAYEFNLPEFNHIYSTQLMISDFDIWLDFMDYLNSSIAFIDALVYVNHSKEKHKAFCLAGIENDKVFTYTEVMISQIDDYWKNQDFI